jgi:hypothetical protein
VKKPDGSQQTAEMMIYCLVFLYSNELESYNIVQYPKHYEIFWFVYSGNYLNTPSSGCDLMVCSQENI